MHAAVVWTLNRGALPREVEVLVAPTVMTAELLSPAPRIAAAPPAPLPRPPEPQKKPAPPAKTQAVRPQEAVVPTPAPPPSPQAAPALPTPAAAPATAAAAPAASTGKAAPSTAPIAEAAPARIELPSTNADYLNNPKPAYPPASKRMGEQGKVVVRVLISADGTAQKAEIRQSSGFDRLDQAALDTVLKWRYVPGKRGGAAETMWFNVPINFVLE